MRDKYLGGSRDALNQQAKVEKMSDEVSDGVMRMSDGVSGDES